MKLNFFLKGDKTKDGLTAIYGKIKLGSTSCTFSTGKYILQDRWEKTNCLRTAQRIETEASLKEHISSIRLSVERTHTKLIKDSDSKITAMDLKKICFGSQIKQEKQISLLDVVNYHNKYFKMQVTKGDRAKGSEEKYVRMGEVLKDFLKS
ncbi:MAG: hypothetical protein IAF38_11130, partial [Bacteroidia bacterium]|nr:hypothetical protein [Bacteroidia bacterium]